MYWTEPINANQFHYDWISVFSQAPANVSNPNVHTTKKQKLLSTHAYNFLWAFITVAHLPSLHPPLQQWSNGAIQKHVCWCCVPHRFQNAIYIKMYPHRSERSLSPPFSDPPTEYIHCIPKYAYIFMGICITL